MAAVRSRATAEAQELVDRLRPTDLHFHGTTLFPVLF